MRYAWMILGLAVLGLVGVTPAPAAEADPFDALGRFEYAQGRQTLAAVDAIVRKAGPAEYPAIEERLLAVLQATGTTKDAKRFICRWLGVVGSSRCVPAVSALLTDEELSHPARMALEPMADPAAGAALRAALGKVQGTRLAGVVASIGMRRDADAVGLLSALGAQGDADVARAAILALGRIGTPEALKALQDLKPPTGLERTRAQARFAAAGQLAVAGHKDQAAGEYFLLLADQAQPMPVRLAALKALVRVLPAENAVALVVKSIQADDVPLRTGTVAAYLDADKALKDAVAAQLPSMKPEGQLLLLRVLADQADVLARPAVLKILDADGPAPVRAAALECLAAHGKADDVALLIRLGRGGTLAEGARKVLDRMPAAGVNEALTAMIRSAAAEDWTIVLGALASRRVETALPTLVELLAAEPAKAIEAAKAIGAMGNLEQLQPLAQRLVRSENPGLRRASEEAVRAIAARAQDKRAAAQALLPVLDKADPAAKRRLLPLLLFTRGPEALDAVQRATKDEDPDLRETAVRTLIAWPEVGAAPLLMELARKAEKPAHAVLAVRDGLLRLAGVKDLPLSERLAIYRGALEAARRNEEKKQALEGLAQLPSLGALELLDQRRSDAELGNDAALAVIRLARQLAPAYPRQAKGALERVRSQPGSDDVRRQAEEAIRTVQDAGRSPDGFLVAWLLSGPYLEEGKDGSALFEIPFVPEKQPEKAEWRPMSATPGTPGRVDIDKQLPGQNRVAYLRTQIASDKEQDALLEMGSDDGLKVWLNGQVVHANNAVRPCSPGQDKIRIRLQKGINRLVLKVTQGGGQWAACCRLRAVDGKDIQGISVGPAEQ